MFSFDPKDFRFRVFSDLDGVEADFDAGVLAKFGQRYEQMHVGYFWKEIGKDPEFYFNLPPMAHADRYWSIIAPFGPTVLTGLPMPPVYEQADRCKRRWVAETRGRPQTPVITCYSRDKHLHITQPGDILIDDTQKNIDAWRAAGGTGILFQDIDSFEEEFIRTVEALHQVR